MSDVFIIGAGCSVPYGFPTGAMLMQMLKDFGYRDYFEFAAQHLLDEHYLFDLQAKFVLRARGIVRNGEGIEIFLIYNIRF